MNGKLVIWLSFALFVGCAIPVEVDVGIGINFDDECAFLLPECSRTGRYFCADAAGVEDPTCEVACLYARTLMCVEDGPECIQTAGEDIPVPVICHSVGE